MSEEVGKEGPILSIFLCEFHHTLGPRISYQYPENFITKEIFDAISVYLIPKPQIVKRVITVNVLGHKVTGYPNEIKNTKYARNALIFNLCFVCGSNSRMAQYETVVKKLSEYLENLELEGGFLSRDDCKEQLPEILKQILHDLNESGKSTVKVILKEKNALLCSKDCDQKAKDRLERRNSLWCRPTSDCKARDGCSERRLSLRLDRQQVENEIKPLRKISEEHRERMNASEIQGVSENQNVSVLHLKVVKQHSETHPVHIHDVPVLVSSRIDVNKLSAKWDLTSQQILPYIDGMTHIARIAAEADVEPNLVIACIQNLLYYGVVKLLPIFQYSNVYTVTHYIHLLYADRELMDECLLYVARSPTLLPTFADVFLMYNSFTYGATVRDLCMRLNPQSMNIDERRLIQFGLIHEFLRRLHQYPVALASEELGHTSLGGQIPLSMLDGSHSFDEICCKFGISYQELKERIERESSIVVMWK